MITSLLNANNYGQWVLWSQWLKWLEEDLVTGEFTAYPLQIANAIRIMSNDVVFIFDEVGCGKTISSGIMARTYLYNEKLTDSKDNVLVITTNAVKETNQFCNDWKKIDSGLTKNVTIYNNLVNSDLRWLDENKKWGLVIIDEAQEFSNTDNLRFAAVKNKLRAKKVVFLTATPIKSKSDFDFYKQLTRSILGKETMDFNALDSFSLTGELKSESELICAKFDPTYPVTRYFKDTVRYLDTHEKKEHGHRVIPEVWNVKHNQGQGRDKVLVEGIQRKLSDKNRFIIFVSRKAEAKNLRELLVEKIAELNVNNVRSIFSDNKNELMDYAAVDGNLPRVLIINYQVGEAGINLPGYNHVIHYHISDEPARLEQRYGRIDRINSIHSELYSVYLVSDGFDTNTNNFMAAVRYTMSKLLSSLPARNVILSEETLGYYKYVVENRRNEIEQQIEEISQYIRFIEEMDVSYPGMKPIFGKIIRKKDISSYSDADKWEKLVKRMEALAGSDEIDESMQSGDEQVAELLLIALKKKICRMEKLLKKHEEVENFEKYIQRISRDSDKIFYLTEKNNPAFLKTIGAQGTFIDPETGDARKGCASYIEEKNDYLMLREIIRLAEASGLVKQYAAENIQYGTQFMRELGEELFGSDWEEEKLTSIIERLGYKNKR